jgi:hypothetical protein
MKEVSFDFVVSKVNGNGISSKEADDLMDEFIEAVEKRGMCLGGGYGECKEEK